MCKYWELVPCECLRINYYTVVFSWRYTRLFATTISISAMQRGNIAATLFRTVTTLFQHTNAVLCCLMSKTTTLHMRHAFLYISLPSLHNYDVKWLKFRSTWERKRPGDKFYNHRLDSGEVPSLQLHPISSLLFTNRVTWDICEIVDLKGWGVCFSAAISWTSPLSDCKVPRTLPRFALFVT